MDNSNLGEYIKSNIARIIELVVVVVIVFTTMQYNINMQGEVLKRVIEQQEKQNRILNGLAVTVAELTIRSGNTEEDVKDIQDDLKYHMNNNLIR